MRPGVFELVGVVIVSAGLAFLVFAGRRPGRGAFLAAVGTGLTIAAYTTVDGVGVRASAARSATSARWWVLKSLCVPLFAAVRRRNVLLKQPRRILLSGLAAGALSVLAYGLVTGADPGSARADRRAAGDQCDLRRDHRHAGLAESRRAGPASPRPSWSWRASCCSTWRRLRPRGTRGWRKGGGAFQYAELGARTPVPRPRTMCPYAGDAAAAPGSITTPPAVRSGAVGPGPLPVHRLRQIRSAARRGCVQPGTSNGPAR